ncbi:MAG: LTA synthase family protein [Bacillota bacterium]|nr:LTA synthase family protein [Bacillota bacterium]
MRKNIPPKFKSFMVNNFDVIFFILIVIIKLLNYSIQTTPNYNYRNLIYPAAASALVLASIALLLNNKHKTRALYIFNIVISIFLVADTIYYRYFKDIISIAVLRNGLLLGGVATSVTALIKPFDFIYLLDIILLIPLLRLYKKVDRKQLAFKFRLIPFIIIFALGMFMDGTDIYKLSVDQPRLISTMFNRVYIAETLGNVNFHALDLYNVVSTKIANSGKLPDTEESAIKTFLTTQSDLNTNKSMAGIGKGKNLIIIQVEALQQFVINNKVNNEEITPNLNKWINRSVYFDNYFYQVANGGTSDAEFMTNNSLYPAASGAAYYLYCGNQYSSLPKEMNDAGYYTAALHGYKEGFWNRNVMYKAQKFDDFYGERAYKQDEVVGLGLSDKSFLNQSVDKLKSFAEPYYSFLITLSSHFPYDDVKGYGDFNTGAYENTFMGNYLKGIHYTDAQLGTFLDRLDKEGITKNSIIVLYGDHYAIPKNQMQQLYDFTNTKNPDDLKWFELQKVPMIIHFPNEEYKGVNHKYSGEMDVYPTVANMFNLPNKYMLGNDLFSNNSNKVTFRNGSFTDGKVFYVSWTNTYYDINTGNTIPETSELKKQKDDATSQLQYSDDILNHNLLKKLEKDK